ncbi:MAG TPA: hypothetical protein VGM51_07625 [Armatimonadota bacterium]
MKRPNTRTIVALSFLAFTTAVAPIATQAGNPLGRILEGGGIALAVSKFGPQVNDFVNKMTGMKDDNLEVTKVVPIISAGKGVYLGAVQVAGPRLAVSKVKAVAQLEGKLSNFRIKALVPVDTTNPTDKPSRVRGVGVTGVIDVKL